MKTKGNPDWQDKNMQKVVDELKRQNSNS